MEQYYFYDDHKKCVINGEHYCALIKTCCQYSSYLVLELVASIDKLPCFPELEIFETTMPEPLSHYFANGNSDVFYYKFYRVCPELCNVMQTITNSLCVWKCESLYFVRGNGSILMQAVGENKISMMHICGEEDFSPVFSFGNWISRDESEEKPCADTKAFYGTDTVFYSRTKDLVGEEYRLLLETCCKHCKYMMLEYCDAEELPDRFKALDAFEIPVPSCYLQGYAPNTKCYRVCPELVECMLSVTQSSFEWSTYQDAEQIAHFNPLDPVFFREDGTAFLYICAHEFMCILSHRNDEDVSVLIANTSWIAERLFGD